MKLILPFLAGIATAIAVAAYFRHPATIAAAQETPRFAPPFSSQRAEDWLNSPALSWAALRGKVVLLWLATPGCAECESSAPWLSSVQERYGHQGLQVIGVSEPEPTTEPATASDTPPTYPVDFPVLLDRQGQYGRLLGSQGLPAWYLIGKHGLIRAVFLGETRAGGLQAAAIETELEHLLTEQ